MKKALFKILTGFWYGFEIGVVLVLSVLLCTGQMAELLSISPVLIGILFIATTLLYLITELEVSVFRKSNDRYRGELDEMKVSYGKLYREHLETKRKYNELYQKSSCNADKEIVKKNERNWNIWIRNRNLDE